MSENDPWAAEMVKCPCNPLYVHACDNAALRAQVEELKALLFKYDCGLTIEAQGELAAKNRELLTIVAKRSAQVEDLRAQRTALCAENEEGWDRVEELTRERDRQRGAAEKHYAVAEDRLVQLERAEDRAERAEAQLKRVEQERDDRRDEGREQTERAIHFMRRCDEAEAKLAEYDSMLEQAHDTGARIMLDQMEKALTSGGRFSDERANRFVEVEAKLARVVEALELLAEDYEASLVNRGMPRENNSTLLMGRAALAAARKSEEGR